MVGQVGAHDPPGPQGLAGMGKHLPRLGQVQEHAVEPLFVDALVDVAYLDPVAVAARTHGGDVAAGPLGEVLPELVAHHLGAGPQKGHRQRTRTHPGLEDPHPGGDVGLDEDGPEVLGIDHLRAPGHLEHGVGEGGPHGQEPPTGAAEDCAPLLDADQARRGRRCRHGCGRWPRAGG